MHCFVGLLLWSSAHCAIPYDSGMSSAAQDRVKMITPHTRQQSIWFVHSVASLYHSCMSQLSQDTSTSCEEDRRCHACAPVPGAPSEPQGPEKGRESRCHVLDIVDLERPSRLPRATTAAVILEQSIAVMLFPCSYSYLQGPGGDAQ